MEQLSLFTQEVSMNTPLASRMRPQTLDDYIGQEHLVGKGKVLRQMLDTDRISSMIFWGPPGVGKTTLARIIANMTHSSFIDFSAVTSGIKEIKDVMKRAENDRMMGWKTIVFVDEIHRFNKAQQDAFLPYVEKGSIILIGATTENPSFEINSALLSRCKVFVLQALTEGDIRKLLRHALTENPSFEINSALLSRCKVFVLQALTEEDIRRLLHHALNDSKGLGNTPIHIEERLVNAIAVFANGDARTALNTLDMAVLNGEIQPDGSIVVKEEVLEQCVGKKMLLYDRNGEEHYNLISALHKSMRNSDPDAAIYWLARMLEAGEDPLYIARRLVRFASEDVGIADSQALQVAVAAYQACHFNGMPECDVNLTHAVVYLSMAPKSNSLYTGYGKAKADAMQMLAEPVPLQIRNGVTGLMQELHYGEGYQYAHDTKEKLTDMECLPESLKGKEYYLPGDQGQEAAVKEKLAKVKAFRRKVTPEG